MEHAAETLRHDRVVLRRWRADDLDALVGLIEGSLDRLLPWMPWAVGYTPESTVAYLADCDEEWRSGEAYNYAILDADAPEDRPLGSCSMMARIGPGGWEIGYWVHREGSGRGLVTMAAAALTRQAFALPGTTHVEVHHDADNHASGAVPRRLGFYEAGRKPEGERITVVWRAAREAAEQAPWWGVSARG
ncbi:GNAT family N-acetyltransferase [Streptacidiphilus rugosus]|uniref:GNAT family N-acetyltransferase n=1 Tax=Streptacidiphilus rugosus TaxID=405783 RepID=UPI0007C70799|nr:GNAT family N-acetyltransferase [Streptacidiphilus rugosus]